MRRITLIFEESIHEYIKEYILKFSNDFEFMKKLIKSIEISNINNEYFYEVI
jgi:hypothetical protein